MSTTPTIRDLDEGVEEKLRARAALHQRSMKANAKEILARSVGEDEATASSSLPAQELMRKAIESVRGSWADRGTTDEWMQSSRADDSDDAYSGR